MDTQLKNFFANKPLGLYVLIFGIALFFLVIIVSTLSIIKNKPSQVVQEKISPLQHTVINKTTEEEVDEKEEVLKKETVSDLEKKYIVKSVNPVYPNEVITEKGVVVFELFTTQTGASGGYPKLSSYLNQLGSPEEIIKGNARHGASWVYSYLFPSKGVVIIANPVTDEVFEIEVFTPMSLTEYKTKYGQYVRPVTQPGP